MATSDRVRCSRDYETFGVIADPSEVLAGTSDPRFMTPGAPLSVWAGATLEGP